MNLTDSKAKLAVGGAICGVVAVLLAILGNPGNMAFCIACFIRDTAGGGGGAKGVGCIKRRSYSMQDRRL